MSIAHVNSFAVQETIEGARRGVIAYRAATLEDAHALAEADPMVKAGRLAVEIYPWMTAKGVFR